jgi:hypothetical protein
MDHDFWYLEKDYPREHLPAQPSTGARQDVAPNRKKENP